MPTKGLAYTKHALNQSFCNSWEEQLSFEDSFQQKAAQTQDYAEGINAFLEKENQRLRGSENKSGLPVEQELPIQ